MPFEKKVLVKGRNKRPDYRVAAGVHQAGTQAHRRLTGYIILSPELMAENDIDYGQWFCLLVGTGDKAGIVRLDFLAPGNEHNLTVRRENLKSDYGMVKSALIPPAPNNVSITEAKFNCPKKGIIDIKLPWDVGILD